MKTRATVVELMICLASGLAFADNPSDAPAMPDQTAPAIVRQEKPARAGSQREEKIATTSKAVERSSKSANEKGRPKEDGPQAEASTL